MDYKRKYKETLEELEDEKIRKVIRGWIYTRPDSFFDNGISKEEMLAWLEKKGEQSICNTPSKEIILAIWELGNDWKELTGGSISTAYGTQLDYIQNHWNESEYYLRAKQDEQKPTNKVEPKFNVGDWITDGYVGGQITSIEDNYPCYKITDFIGGINTSIPFTLQDNYHLWTIQDAKEGDVLANDHHILILKELYYDWYSRYSNGTPYSVKAYCGIKPSGNFEIGKDNWCFCGTLHIHPATKEQRDLLFQKMKEAGYEWDAEKKESKKIEKKPVPKRKAEGVLKEMLENIDEEELKQTKKEMLE